MSRQKIVLSGYEMWLDKSEFPAIMIYDTKKAKHGVPIDVMSSECKNITANLIRGRELTQSEKEELAKYLNK